MDRLFPVILAVPAESRTGNLRRQKGFLSRFARQAVRQSARSADIPITELLTDSNGCPIPENGGYWSLSHKPLYVAGVAAFQPVGIDVEPIRPVDEPLFRRVSDADERSLVHEDRDRFFCRLWTAKEAVVKTVGGRFADIFRCRVAEVPDEHHLVVSFMETRLHVEHCYFDGHVASLVAGEQAVCWRFENG